MKKLIETSSNPWTFEEYKNNIDNLIANKNISKLKLQENYFEICNNYWIIDKPIAKFGQCEPDLTPNTLSTYDVAIKEKCAILISVEILDDGNLVCFSHKNISKVVASTDGYLNKLTLSELKDIDLNENKEKVPTLEEALDHIANRTQIVIDIHNDGMIGKFEDKVLSILCKYIKKYNCINNVAIMSINPFSLQYCFSTEPYITRILKSGSFEDKMYGSISTKKLKKLKYFKITNADFICYSQELLPCGKVEKHKPVGVIADNVTNQQQYINVAPHCDNILFNNFKPTI